jgi:hypothetical protein
MEFIEIKSLEENINKPNSKLWSRMNDNSKAAKNREQFVSQHGGSFYKEGRFWKWRTPAKEQNGYRLKNIKTGEEVFFSNMTEFGKNNGLTAVKICELLNGKRKTYHGWTAVELREVKDSVGSNFDIKEPPKIKVKITKSTTFIDTKTNEIIIVENINQYAKEREWDPKSLYKVARGKLKSYKGLKIYDPLEKYQPSKET